MCSVFKIIKFLLSYKGMNVLIFIFSFILSYILDKIAINPGLKEYTEFIGDNLNFVSIVTGFLAALIGIVATMPMDSLIFKNISENKTSKKEFVISLLLPFITGLINIVVSIYFRLKVNNIHLIFSGRLINIIFLYTLMSFILQTIVTVVMSGSIIYLSINSSQDSKNDMNVRKDYFNF